MPARSSVSALVVLAALLTACAPAPEQVCGHVVALSKAELGEALTSLSADELSKLEARCVEDAKLDRQADRKAYARRAECVLAADSLAAVGECSQTKPAD